MHNSCNFDLLSRQQYSKYYKACFKILHVTTIQNLKPLSLFRYMTYIKFDHSINVTENDSLWIMNVLFFVNIIHSNYIFTKSLKLK